MHTEASNHILNYRVVFRCGCDYTPSQDVLRSPTAGHSFHQRTSNVISKRFYSPGKSWLFIPAVFFGTWSREFRPTDSFFKKSIQGRPDGRISRVKVLINGTLRSCEESILNHTMRRPLCSLRWRCWSYSCWAEYLVHPIHTLNSYECVIYDYLGNLRR